MMCSCGKVNPISPKLMEPVTVITCGFLCAQIDGANANVPSVNRLFCKKCRRVII
jgi:hypothetical protein